MDEPLRFLEADGTLAPNAREPQLPAEELRRLYRLLVQTRVLDETLLAAHREGRIPFYLPSSGEEAASLGAVSGLRDTDWIFLGPRDAAALLRRGMGPGAYLRRWLHGAFGFSGESEGPWPFSWEEARSFPFASPGPARLPQAVGFAWAARMQSDRIVALVSFGEAATSHGDFHAAMNLAGVFRVPVVFLCRNNRPALPEDWPPQSATESVAEKAAGYGFGGVRVDGGDLLAVGEAVREAAERARAGEGPSLVEALLCREPGGPARRVQRCGEEGDPIPRFRRYLVLKGLWTDAEEAALWVELRAAAAEEARACGAPEKPRAEVLFEGVYRSMPAHLGEQLAALKGSPDGGVDGGR
jgi:2-oxoisovalerate dehydrogenase E1 component alpha subunit